MAQWTNEEIDAFLKDIGMCKEGYDAMNALGNYGLTLDEAANNLKNAGYPKFAEWILAQKQTEAYVRFNGTVCTYGEFKVINPITMEEYTKETAEEIHDVLVEIIKQMISNYGFTVVKETPDENGNVTWEAVDMTSGLIVE